MDDGQNLPEWDLTDLYQGPDSVMLEADLRLAKTQANEFRSRYQGKLAQLDGAGLGEAVEAYEHLSEIIGRIMSFAQLLQAERTTDPTVGRFYQTIQERVNAIAGETLFFALELNKIEDSLLEAQLADPVAARYASWILDSRAVRPYQLEETQERLLHEKDVAGRSAWIRLFDETIAHLRFDLGGAKKPLAETLNQLTDVDGHKRREAGRALSETLRASERLFTTITNTLAKDKEIEDRWRGFKNPAHPQHLANKVEKEVVDALVEAVCDSYGDLAHRYYGLKADWMGVENLDWWDRNAPFPQESARRFSWTESRDIILKAYYAFEPRMANIARRFFDNRWIDANPRDGKNSGAFAHPTVPSAHPYILLNFHGKSRDVMTLSHELGHGIHQVLAARQGLLLSQTPLTLAETASVFGEMLTFRSLLDAEHDSTRRCILLVNKIEDMLNTVVRQIAFHEFETLVHNERKSGELSPERLSDIWIETQRASLGPHFNFDDDYRVLWSYIPHFIHMPFYVYAYAFGDCLVNTLYAIFEDGHSGFQSKYMDMLAQGGAKGYKELLEPFGLDASDRDFWKNGLMVISGFIDELEAAL